MTVLTVKTPSSSFNHFFNQDLCVWPVSCQCYCPSTHHPDRHPLPYSGFDIFTSLPPLSLVWSPSSPHLSFSTMCWPASITFLQGYRPLSLHHHTQSHHCYPLHGTTPLPLLSLTLHTRLRWQMPASSPPGCMLPGTTLPCRCLAYLPPRFWRPVPDQCHYCLHHHLMHPCWKVFLLHSGCSILHQAAEALPPPYVISCFPQPHLMALE